MIAIIDYGMGNLASVKKAFTKINIETIITNDRKSILNADKVILPGVGAFNDAINNLKKTKLDLTIKEFVLSKKPLLGICLGMQLLFEKSYENGEFEGLKILSGEVVKFKSFYDNQKYKIPQIGWNSLIINKKEPLYKDIDYDEYVYFVHSYFVKTKSDIISAYTKYGEKIAVSIQKENVYATQFHPEKSGEIGLKILKNFGDL